MTGGVRVGKFSARVRQRHAIVVALLAVCAAVVSVASLTIGDVAISVPQVLRALTGGGDPLDTLVILDLRLPRAALALLIGATLGMTGAATQVVARNAIATPDLLGVSAGASAGAVAVIVLNNSPGPTSALLASGTTVAAVIGGLAAAAFVGLILARIDTGGVQPLLVGIGVSAFFGGVVSWLLISAELEDAARATVWLSGSLNGLGRAELVLVVSVVTPVLIGLLALAPRLVTLSLGPAVARGLGCSTGLISGTALVLCVIAVAIAVSVAGPIGFIGLVAPHVARLATGAAAPPLIGSAAAGALFVAGADLAARSLFAPVVLPTGAVTALVGAPFLVWLLTRQRKGLT